MPFSSHAAKTQQCTEGFACSRSGKDKNVAKVSRGRAAGQLIQSAAKQLNQMLLPFPRLDRCRVGVSRKVEAAGADGVPEEG
jgi:hypothetical protein